MKKITFLLLFVFLAVSAHAETLTLKNGSKITGKIISSDDKKTKIEVDGAVMTYYADEIENGETMAENAPLPVASKAITPVDPAKKVLILKFIEVFGTKAAMAQNLQAMTENLPADNPDYEKIKKGINVEEIIDRLVPTYAKYFSEEDLKDYIEFYSSPKGKKLIDAISKVMRESVDVSAQYFQEKFPESNQ